MEVGPRAVFGTGPTGRSFVFFGPPKGRILSTALIIAKRLSCRKCLGVGYHGGPV